MRRAKIHSLRNIETSRRSNTVNRRNAIPIETMLNHQQKAENVFQLGKSEGSTVSELSPTCIALRVVLKTAKRNSSGP
jgi:hypothetical protein